ncbi:MAG: hypothetical protein IT262_15980 [Saprospiraceae bacterium]|nr:hypothetical protein [Saprospiraceae bacterium]
MPEKECGLFLRLGRCSSFSPFTQAQRRGSVFFDLPPGYNGMPLSI